MNHYNIEITDFGGRGLNSAWVKRYEIKSKSIRGAIQKFRRIVGDSYKFVAGGDDWAVYHSTTGCIGVTIEMVGE